MWRAGTRTVAVYPTFGKIKPSRVTIFSYKPNVIFLKFTYHHCREVNALFNALDHFTYSYFQCAAVIDAQITGH